MKASLIGSVSDARGCPTIGAGIVSCTGVEIMLAADVQKYPTPNDHFAAGPHRRMRVSGGGCVGKAGRCPTIGVWVISPAGVQKQAADVRGSAPDDHFAADPDCRVTESGSRHAGSTGGCPTVNAGVVSPASVYIVRAIISAPDNHLATGPDGRVLIPGRGRAAGARRYPTVGTRVISPAGIQIA